MFCELKFDKFDLPFETTWAMPYSMGRCCYMYLMAMLYFTVALAMFANVSHTQNIV